MHGFEHQIVAILEQVFQFIGWTGVVIIMALESANIPIPSEVTMPLAGWMLTPAPAHSGLEAFATGGFLGGLGCLIGSVVSYWMGRFGGRPLVERYGNYILVRRHDIEVADRWFSRWGDAVAFGSRLLPIVRTFVSFPAGMFKIHFLKFSFYTFIGSFVWCGALAWIGWRWGQHWERILDIVGPFKYPIALLILLGGIWYVYRHLKPEATVMPASHVEEPADGG